MMFSSVFCTLERLANNGKKVIDQMDSFLSYKSQKIFGKLRLIVMSSISADHETELESLRWFTKE